MPMKLQEKIKEAPRLSEILAGLKKNGKKVVFTNGCFDILHPGHLFYLNEARALGDLLVVGINNDASVRNLKGEGRPVNPEKDRALMLAGLSCVDFVTFFGEPDPYNLIALLIPDVLVKGGDWTPDRIIGADLVEKEGGKVLSLPFKPGYSTTGLIEKIVAQYGKTR